MLKNIIDEIVNYYKQDATLLKFSAIIFGVLLVGVVLIIFCKYLVNKKRSQNEENKILESMQDAEKIQNFDDMIYTDDDNIANEIIQKDSVQDFNQSQETKENTVTTNISQVEDLDNLNEKTEPTQKSKPKKSDTIENKKDEQPVQEPVLESVQEPIQPAVNIQPTKYSGKWVIAKQGNIYYATLMASNGEILLRTEGYQALSGIKSGIETVKNNIQKDNTTISIDKNGNFFFKVYSSATRLLCISEGYSTKQSCENAINSVKRFSKTAIIITEKE